MNFGFDWPSGFRKEDDWKNGHIHISLGRERQSYWINPFYQHNSFVKLVMKWLCN